MINLIEPFVGQVKTGMERARSLFASGSSRLNRGMSKLWLLLALAFVFAPIAARADGSTPPLDLSATGTTIAGYIATAAGAGVAILAAMYGIRVIIRAFKAVK